jgi:hypothetical protein
MKSNFSMYCRLQELCESHSLYIPENFDWVKPYLNLLPNYDLQLPIVTKKSKIHMIQRNKNPITIHFENGGKMYCSHDEFLRLPKNLELGKTIEYTLFDRGFDKPMIIKSFKIIS